MKIYKVIEKCPMFSLDYRRVKDGIFVNEKEAILYMHDLDIIEGIACNCSEYHIEEFNINIDDFKRMIDRIVFDYNRQHHEILSYRDLKYLNGWSD